MLEYAGCDVGEAFERYQLIDMCDERQLRLCASCNTIYNITVYAILLIKCCSKCC